MLDPKEIDIEIARLEYGESSYPAYAKLANLYTIRNQITRNESSAETGQSYSLAASTKPTCVGRYGDSEFLSSIEGLDEQDVFLVIDDLMGALQVTNPRVYNGVMRKIKAL